MTECYRSLCRKCVPILAPKRKTPLRVLFDFVCVFFATSRPALPQAGPVAADNSASVQVVRHTYHAPPSPPRAPSTRFLGLNSGVGFIFSPVCRVLINSRRRVRPSRPPPLSGSASHVAEQLARGAHGRLGVAHSRGARRAGRRTDVPFRHPRGGRRGRSFATEGYLRRVGRPLHEVRRA